VSVGVEICVFVSSMLTAAAAAAAAAGGGGDEVSVIEMTSFCQDDDHCSTLNDCSTTQPRNVTSSHTSVLPPLLQCLVLFVVNQSINQSINQSTVHLYSAEALTVSKALERRQSVVSKQESFKIMIENVNGE